MKKAQLLRRILDVAMTALSVLLMGGIFAFPDDAVHEILGTALIVLWIAHNVLNRAFYKSLPRGTYTARRIAMVCVNGALLACCLLLAVSGIMLSNRVFAFLGIGRGMGFARAAHLVSSHWYYILMAVHFSLHIGALASSVPLFKKLPPGAADPRSRRAGKTAVRAAVLLVCIYGVHAFFLRGYWKYLFLTQPFFFFDTERGFALFLADYCSLFVLFSAVSCCVFRLLPGGNRHHTES